MALRKDDTHKSRSVTSFLSETHKLALRAAMSSRARTARCRDVATAAQVRGNVHNHRAIHHNRHICKRVHNTTRAASPARRHPRAHTATATAAARRRRRYARPAHITSARPLTPRVPPPTLGVYSTNLAPVDAAAHARTTTCDRPPLTPLTPRAAVAAPQPPLARAHRAPPPTPPRSQSPLPMGRSHCVVPTAYTHPSPASHTHALPHAKPERSPPLPARVAASTCSADAHPYAKPTPNRGLAHLHHRHRQPAAAAASRANHTRAPCARDSPRARATPQATASLAVACCHDNDMWARAIRRS